MADHDLNPNRGVKRWRHTACMRVCREASGKSPLSCVLASSSAMYPYWLRHRRSRSAPSDQISTIEASAADVAVAQNDLPPSCATGPVPVAHPASRSMTSPPPSVTVLIRPAADVTTTRDGRLLAQAATAYAADGPASYAR